MSVTIRHRDDGSVELRVNGVFVMDDVETGSERALALRVVAAGARRILVGGLGLGFTVRELLAGDAVEHVAVAELHPEIVEAMRAGDVPGADMLDDPRVVVTVGDVRAVVAEQPPRGLDAIVLDVDNGPDYLVHQVNAAVYGPSFLRICAERLVDDGRVGVWSMADSPSVRAALAEAFLRVEAEAIPVHLQGRDEHYWILWGVAPRRRVTLTT